MLQATDRDTGNFSSVQYRISSGNDGGFFKMDENTGFITTASNFRGKKGQRFTIQVSAHDNHGQVPTNEVQEKATAQVCNVYLYQCCVQVCSECNDYWFFFGIHFENKTKTYIEKTRLRAVVLFSSDLLASGNE